jgi:chemosensory pili system protein ChpA (sensor histidine kinase/response regulator)
LPVEVPDEVRVGDRTISRPLYDIFLSEADDLIATLGADTAAWADQPARAATEAAQRAMHSLKGSAALVELHGVQAIAEQLETFLLRQRASGRPMTDADLSDYARTIERVQAMLHRFAAGSAPGEEPEALALAHALASRWDPRNEPQPEPEAVAVRVPMANELDEELLPIFIEEATDYLPKIGENLRRWQSSPADRSLQQLLMRHLHTVKGSARMAGAMDLGQLVHEMETRIEAASALSVVPAALIEELIADYDGAVAMFEAIRDAAARAGGRGPAATVAAAPTTPVAASPAAVVPAGAAPAAEPEPKAPARSAAEASRPTAARPDAAPAQTGPAPAAQSGLAIPGAAVAARAAAAAVAPSLAAASLVRVRSDLLERVVNESGEVSIARSRLDNELGQLRQSLQDLTENVARLRSQLREIEIQAESQIQARIALQRETSAEFDPLEFDRYTRFQELTRMLAESVNDVATVQQNAMRSLDDASQDMVRQSQVLRELQQNLMRMRMVQFGSISDRLYRVVRQAAKELGKRVALDIRGASVEVDRGVLERMANPVEHLLRNAVAHGIEPPAQREAAGKPETGEIRVEVRQEGNEVVLAVSDDGAGLDYAKILARARHLGLVADGAQPGERELADMIFTPGFSTAAEVTELAGRGVGTDVVRAEVLSLGGRIDVDSTRGAATRFTVHLPLTLAIAQVVLVSVGASQYAIPSSSVEQVLQLKPQALAAAYGDGSIDWQGARVPMHYLGALVGVGDARPIAQHLSPVVIVRSANLRLAIHVDAVSRNQEVVVKNVGAQVARVPGVSGATVLGNGEIVLILNPARLAQAVLGDLWLERPAPGTRSAPLAEVPPAVMVVDDSLTVRKATQRLLAREGYDVMLAKDGVDALRQLQDRQPDVMLVDIEMPRMDGFDLTRHVRGDERFRELPIVMITSRTADKHRNYAMSLGVNAYLGKPYRDDELLGQVAMFTSSRRRRAGA